MQYIPDFIVRYTTVIASCVLYSMANANAVAAAAVAVQRMLNCNNNRRDLCSISGRAWQALEIVQKLLSFKARSAVCLACGK